MVLFGSFAVRKRNGKGGAEISTTFGANISVAWVLPKRFSSFNLWLIDWLILYHLMKEFLEKSLRILRQLAQKMLKL